MTHHDEADFCLPNSGNSPIIPRMSIRTRLHISGNPSVACAVQEYLQSFRPPMNALVGRMFRNIYRLNPELPRKFMHEVNQDQLTEEILPPSKSLATVYSTRSCWKISSATLCATAGWIKASN